MKSKARYFLYAESINSCQDELRSKARGGEFFGEDGEGDAEEVGGVLFVALGVGEGGG